ncbi:hypothetical protein LCGC14_1233280 [marine sediment metagenome]|uniref:Uncharacterized protein n=1 Tax=marine sediment metagenome TaxID=412755 RepID=A0A0F9LV68_9ZZZZ
MATVKQIVSAQLSQRQRQINQQAERAELFDPDRLLCNIIRVDGNINVPSRPGFVWCQEYSPLDDTSPFHAFNDKIQAREGLTVWIGKGLGGRREVLDWNNGTIINTPDYAAQKYLPTHHSDHEWPDFKPGPDVVNVYPRSLSMLRTYPGEGGALTVSASPLRYIKGNALVVFPGKNSLDISASQPASGLARFVGIYLDPDDNTLKSIDGATTSDSPAITPDSPAFPESAILSANVRLNGAQTVFSEIDMVDVRQILDASGAIDGARVSKLISPDGLIDPVLSADNSGEVGIGTAAPGDKLEIICENNEGVTLTKANTVLQESTSFDIGHSKFVDQETAGGVAFRMIFQAGGDEFDILNEAGNEFIATFESTETNFFVSNITKATVDADGIEVVSGDGDGITLTKANVALQEATNFVIGHSEFIDQEDAGGAASRMLFKAGNDKFDILNEAGNEFIATFESTEIKFFISNSAKATLDSAGKFGIGTTSPQGILHTYDAISGFINWEFDGLDATVRTIIPNGTGDVLYRLTALFVLRDSAAAVASGTTDVSNGASVNLTVGTNTVRLRVNADGSTDIARTAGTDTIKVALVLRWL